MNPQIFLSCLCLGLAAAIISVVIICIMPHERILNWWFMWGERVGHKRVGNSMAEKWFYRPIWGCEKCLAGQLACWAYILRNWRHYGAGEHILTICMAILSAVVLSFFISHIINTEN